MDCVCVLKPCCIFVDIGDAQEPSADVDGAHFVTQIVVVWLPTQVVGCVTQLRLRSLTTSPKTWMRKCGAWKMGRHGICVEFEDKQRYRMSVC